MHISIYQGAATYGANNYQPGTHLYPWVERGTLCVITLPKGVNLYRAPTPKGANLYRAGIEPTTHEPYAFTTVL